MAYVSPTGYVDPDNGWQNEGNAFDDNTATISAHTTTLGNSWSTFLVLTHDSLLCEKVRLWLSWDLITVPTADVDVYYGGAWHDLFEGSWTVDEWVEILLSSSQSLTAIRVRIYNPYSFGISVYVNEVDFYEVVPTVTTQAATQIAYQCAIGNGTITSSTNATERGFEIVVNFSGTLLDYFLHQIAGFVGDVTFVAAYHWEATMTKIEHEHGNFAEGVYELVLGYPSASYDLYGTPDYSFDDKLFKCESYTYRAYAVISGITYYGAYVAFDTLCDAGGDQQPTDDISDGDPTVPIIPIDIPPFEWEFPPEIPYPPWDWDLPDLPPWILPDLPEWEIPDYPPESFVGNFYYRKPYTKKDLDELRAKCIIYNKNSVEFALVLRHNMNVLKEFFNMMTDYMDKDEFNDFTDLIPPQRLKELYLDNLEVNDFKDMINGFIRNTVDNNMAVNRNFSLIQEGLSGYETGNDDAYFRDISSAMTTVTEDNPDVDTLKRYIDNLNQETSSNFSTIMHNLEILRAKLL